MSEQPQVITLHLVSGEQVTGSDMGEDETWVYLKLMQVYETEDNIWLPGNEKSFHKGTIKAHQLAGSNEIVEHDYTLYQDASTQAT